ncbi:aldo/keto reductase [Actinomadura rupiterrae]|uniref:aldo/keto reductase n=1 Tax=Actinomadura rupiterrae TaxID=559627 RepID=UPI0020A47CA4|nr:aldo/keto reductase [Actinomadura rupiterrae]MCP2335696.1 D-threo-aldose 1-dehydrogenase [Actinomadura rupiterrae]
MKIPVTPLAFGSAAIGGLYAPVPPDTGVHTVQRALEAGMRYLDTAPHYGAGKAERILGAALSDVPRESFTISTKVGRVLRPLRPGESPDSAGFEGEPPVKREWDFSRDGVLRSLESSLERLGIDRVDMVYLHDPDAHEDEVYASAYPALAELREQGVVGAIGAGMNQTEMLTRFVRRLDLDVVLCAGRYTLLDRSAEAELLPACVERGTAVVVGGAYNSGLLAGGTTYNYESAPVAMLERVAELERVCTRYDVPLRAAALQFPMRHPAVASVLVGCRTPEEVTENAALFALDVPEDLWKEL